MIVNNKTCMLAKAPRGDENLSSWVLEPKYDGHRMIATVRGGVVRIYARSGVDKTGHLPNVEAALALLPDCVVDGEVVGRDWGAAQEVLGSSSRVSTELEFVVFDVLEAMGVDVRDQPLTQRRAVLDLLLQHIDATGERAPVTLSPQLPFSQETVDNLIAEGWEGAVVKDPRSTYQSGRRSPKWLKFKATATEDVVVMGATPGRGKFSNMIGALVFGQYDAAGVLRERGKCSGMTDAQRADFTAMHRDDALEGLVIEVAHMGVMPTGGWRHPQFKRVRTDKAPEECVA